MMKRTEDHKFPSFRVPGPASFGSIFLLLAVIALPASGEIPGVKTIPPGGMVIARSDTEIPAITNCTGDAAHAKFSVTAVSGEKFTRALGVQTLKQPESIQSIQVFCRSTWPVKKDDVMLAAITARGRGTLGRAAWVQLAVGQSAPDGDVFSSRMMSLLPEWQRFYLPCTALNNYAAGKISISLSMGFDPQEVEIADIELINYGMKLKKSDLPRSQLTYQGREASASWRKAAAERIDKFRKAGLDIRVVNSDGTPAPGADISIRMTRQAFPFGSAVNSWLLRRNSADADRYRDMVDKLFTYVTVETETCQFPWEKERHQALELLQWLHDHGKTVHGCHIIWPITDGFGMPDSIAKFKTKPDEVRRLVMAHIDDKLAATKGLVQEWNAVNELYSNKFFEESMGSDKGKAFVVDIFRHARQVDPSVRLAINDYGDMANPSQAHIDGYLTWIKYLKKQKTPVDVVGLQGHFAQFMRSPDECLAILDRFADYGYPLHVTELDINTPDEAVQADYMRDIMTVLYSHPAVEQITLWGFWEGSHWMPLAALWRKDWSIKPNGQVWMDLVFKEWRTNTAMKTDGRGMSAARAFLGDYEVTVSSQGKSITQKVPVPKTGASVEIKLP